MSYYIYIVRCEDGSHYTGITTDPRRRMREHVLRLTPGAKYTKSHRVIALDALWSAQTRSEACRLEAAVKRLRAEQKRSLIAQPDRLHDFLGARIDRFWLFLSSSYHAWSLQPYRQDTQRRRPPEYSA